MTIYSVLLIFALYGVFVIVSIFMTINEKEEQGNEYEANKNNINDPTDFISKVEHFKF